MAAGTPTITAATTAENTQSTTGLVISRNVADGAEVTHFKVTAITRGRLFQNDGVTAIASGDFITFAQGNAGLKFTPPANYVGTGTFVIQAALGATDGDLGGSTVTATVTITAVPFTGLSTRLRNTGSTSLFFGFIGNHGTTIPAASSVSIPGNIFDYLRRGNRNHARSTAALKAALTAGVLEIISGPATTVYDPTTSKVRTIGITNDALAIFDPDYGAYTGVG